MIHEVNGNIDSALVVLTTPGVQEHIDRITKMFEDNPNLRNHEEDVDGLLITFNKHDKNRWGRVDSAEATQKAETKPVFHLHYSVSKIGE